MILLVGLATVGQQRSLGRGWPFLSQSNAASYRSSKAGMLRTLRVPQDGWRVVEEKLARLRIFDTESFGASRVWSDQDGPRDWDGRRALQWWRSHFCYSAGCLVPDTSISFRLKGFRHRPRVATRQMVCAPCVWPVSSPRPSRLARHPQRFTSRPCRFCPQSLGRCHPCISARRFSAELLPPPS